MRRALAFFLLVGLSVAVAKSDEKPTTPVAEPGTVEPEDDSRLTQQTGAQPQKIGVLSYVPNKGGGYTFLEGGHIAFYALPYIPSTYQVEVPTYYEERGRNGRATTVHVLMELRTLETIGTRTMQSGGQVLYRSRMKVIASAARRRVDTPIAKWTRSTSDGAFHLSITTDDPETRLKLKSIIPVLERTEHGR
jgi:hypothetical protein